MIASYVRPTSIGSTARYGTSHSSESERCCAYIPFLIASWCEPENAVYTSSPAYGWRGWTGSSLHSSTIAFASSIRERSSPGSTPCVSRFSASVTRSTLPVRSPFPNSVPSTRSAPAISPSSAVATAVPRSLCGWTLSTIRSRAETCRWNHSSRSAYTFGGNASTVVGRLTIIFSSTVGRHSAITASQISSA